MELAMNYSRLLFLIGTIHWFLFASGHSIIVDIDFVLGMHSPLGPEVLPNPQPEETIPQKNGKS